LIKVMIVEDEPPIARSLAKLISKIDSEFEVVAIADNGKSAIERYNTALPDVIFTDIRMPVMDGFGFLEYLRKNDRWNYVVILSGYQDFSYAREAIKYKVFDYLLKPISTGGLEEILGKLKQEFISLKKAEKNQMIEKTLNEQSMKNTEIGQGNCIACILCMGSFPANPDDVMLSGAQEWDDDLLEKTLNSCCNGIVSYWQFNGISCVEKIVIFEFPEDCVDMDLSNRIFTEIAKLTTMPVTLISHRDPVNISAIGAMHTMLRTDLYHKIVFGKSSLLWLDHKNEELDYPDIDEKIQNVYHAVSDNDHGKLDLFLRDFLNCCEKHDLTQNKITRYFYIILAYYCEKFPIAKLTNANTDVGAIISNTNTYEGLYNEISTLFQASLEVPETVQMINHLAESVKEYLELNFSEPITNDTLASQFRFVASYLSRIFKSQYGISPGNFLVKLRINKAKSIMLETPDILIKEVAKMVGYKDQYYFSKVFHKETGFWPTEYK